MTKLFQSYLIIGQNEEVKEKTKSFLKNFGFEVKKGHTDFFIISPVKESVGIDQIRELKTYIFKKPLKGRYKSIVIEQAHRLTTEAQNALLKILEEPPSYAVIILQSESKANLTSTILSRVTLIHAPGTIDEELAEKALLVVDTDITSRLESLSAVDDPKSFLNEQMVAIYNSMIKETLEGKISPKSLSKNGALLEKCARVKEMIDANVNPKFALLSMAI